MKAKNRTFPHDFNARNSLQLQQILMSFGCEGIGIYWCLVEMLYEAGGILPLEAGIKSAAYQLHVKRDKIERIINTGLFEKDKQNFWSFTIVCHEATNKGLSEKRRNAAVQRWNKEYANAEQKSMQMQSKRVCKCNAKEYADAVQVCQQRKEKEDKEKKEKKETGVKEKEINKEKEKEKEITSQKSVPNPPIPVLPTTLSKPIEQRKAEFLQKLEPYRNLYGEEIVHNFFEYWSEMNKSQTKMRFELERTYEIPLRLSTWANRNNSFVKSRPRAMIAATDTTTTYTTKIE